MRKVHGHQGFTVSMYYCWDQIALDAAIDRYACCFEKFNER
jgi:hypothetical protein